MIVEARDITLEGARKALDVLAAEEGDAASAVNDSVPAPLQGEHYWNVTATAEWRTLPGCRVMTNRAPARAGASRPLATRTGT